MVPWEGEERLVSELRKLIDFFPPLLIFTAYLGHFSKYYSSAKYKKLQLPLCNVSEKIYEKIFETGLKYSV